jgi:hypothetical protein
MESVVTATRMVKITPKPPVAKGFPVIGSIPDILREQLAFLENAQAKYGDVYSGTRSI